MSIIIHKNTKILVQGFTGKIGSFHAEEMIKYGSNVVGGVTPGKGGMTHLNLPVFNTVKEAVDQTGASTSILFVPPAFAADSAMEAADAGIKTCVAITDGIPSHDMVKIKRYMRRYPKDKKMGLVGPNCAGIISPGKSMLGIMPGHIYKEGKIGIVSRSGTLGYEAAQQLKDLEIGVSTSVGIGGDPINGSSFRDIIEKFENDDETIAVLMIGEIGGPQEVEAGKFAKENMSKPIIISPGKSMLGIMPGHIYKEGKIGIVSRSGTLGYEAAQQLKDLEIGVSTSVGIGGDPINGSSFRDIIEKFENDDETIAVLMIGEIGGPQEVEAGQFAKENMSKPVIAYIAGLTAPKGRVMGHAGAIVSAYGESAIEKVELLKECGVTISKNPSVMGETVKKVLVENNLN